MEEKKKKNPVLIVFLVLVAFLFLKILFSPDKSAEPEAASQAVDQEVTEPAEEVATAQEPSIEAKEVAPTKASTTLTRVTSEDQALKSALNYLRHQAFSHDGLVEQLEFEGYSKEDAIAAADQCGADWNEQAVEKASDYLRHQHFSYKSLIDQLEFSGFTAEQAEYGADNCGADWKEQAAGKASDYLEHQSYSRDRLVEQLEFEGFTPEEAEYGVGEVYE